VKQAVVPLTINLPNGETVQSTHTCKINIPGLPEALTSHIMPGLSMASLMEICVLCKAGCTVIFTDTTVEVINNTKVILHGSKVPAMDLWTLPITPTAILYAGTGKTSQMLANPFLASSLACLQLGKGLVNQKHPALNNIAAFTYLNASKCGKVCPSIPVQP
jgi:hypothetical protein